MAVFVDLPGYGYSKMSKQEQVKVGSFIEQYLKITHMVLEEQKFLHKLIL